MAQELNIDENESLETRVKGVEALLLILAAQLRTLLTAKNNGKIVIIKMPPLREEIEQMADDCAKGYVRSSIKNNKNPKT